MRLGDEQLAKMLLSNNRSSVFPDLKLASKYKPHGARQITNRAWKCDPYLRNLAEDMATAKSSI
eukprot:6878700-Lingulodinium_polyedra.AAC.1